MVDVDGSSYLSADSQLKSVGLVWGLAATRHSVCIHQMNRVNSRSDHGHEYSTINIVVDYYYYYFTPCHELCKNGRTDRDAVWDVGLRGSRERVLHGDVDASWVGALFGVSGRLKSIILHRILGLGKRVSCAQNGWTNLNDLYVVWCVFVQGVAFWGHDDCTCVKTFSGIDFFIMINPLMHLLTH